MKRYMFGLSAVVMAIAFSAFTNKSNTSAKLFVTEKFAQYTGAVGVNEKVATNYTVISTFSSCPLANTLCQISFDDANGNNVLDQTELNAVFTARDTDSDNQISDQAEVGTFPRIEKKP